MFIVFTSCFRHVLFICWDWSDQIPRTRQRRKEISDVAAFVNILDEVRVIVRSILLRTCKQTFLDDFCLRQTFLVNLENREGVLSKGETRGSSVIASVDY